MRMLMYTENLQPIGSFKWKEHHVAYGFYQLFHLLTFVAGVAVNILKIWQIRERIRDDPEQNSKYWDIHKVLIYIYLFAWMSLPATRCLVKCAHWVYFLNKSLDCLYHYSKTRDLICVIVYIILLPIAFLLYPIYILDLSEIIYVYLGIR